MKHRILVALLCALLVPALHAGTVRIWEDSITIPTYKWDPPDPTPLFFEGRTYQGAKGPVYPYPIIDSLTDVKEDRTYKAVWLENRYIKICVLPELGGRIFSAVDKTNNYDFFYRQHVIKPALIGMLGAWISGGVEWNIPHHHRASSFMPVRYQVDENADGSKTVWLGEMELRHRMRWLVGLTLYPDRSYLQGTVKLMNRTPVSNSFLYFANVSVHTNNDYQVIFPPTTQYATQHAKSEFSGWPVSHSIYGGVDFRKGVEVSWWKNQPKPISMFAFESKEDFLAGYDHGKEAGTLHVADHGAVPGKKFFAWGNGPEGQVWDRILTDTDGPYLELMVGGYSDNQPDYSWIQPYEVKTINQFWYPFQRIAGVKNANLQAAVNLEVAGGSARVAFASTSEYPTARAILRAGDQKLLDETISIDPGKPFLKNVSLPAGVGQYDLRASLEAGGKELVAYRPVRLPDEPMPKPVQPPAPPKQMKTTEELYLAGMRLVQFHSPAMEPDPYFEEALRRDPADARANTALGILYWKRGLFREAEQKLQAAADKISRNYTSPRDGEPLYYLALAQKAQGNYAGAHESFYKASWSSAWHTAAYYALAELECLKGSYSKALEYIDAAIATNAENTKALNLKAAILRQLGRNELAATAATSSLAVDPLDAWSRRELRLSDGGTPQRIVVSDSFTNDVQPYLEMAADYASAGLWNESASALRELAGGYPDKNRVFPMIYYWLGYVCEKAGDKGSAETYYELAPKMPVDFVFPFRLESIAVLRRAIERNAADARAPYYLGNLLYDLQPERAIEAWERARSLDPGSALTNRNLAFAYARVRKDYGRAASLMETALARKPDARFLFELDQINEWGGVAAEKRLAELEKHHDVAARRDDTLAREIRLNVQLGRYDRAFTLLADRHFHVWEGGGRFSVRESYMLAHLLKGQEFMRARQYADALHNYQAALEYPERFSEGKPYYDESEHVIDYHIATAHDALGNQQAAIAAFEKAAGAARGRHGIASEDPEVLYYQALAMRKLGRAAEADAIFDRLIKQGRETLATGGRVDYFAKFGERQSERARAAQGHYVLALGYLGAGKRTEAKAELEQAYKLNQNHLGAKTQLANLL
jgi:tetratricopeptide (TPR) repeat protein